MRRPQFSLQTLLWLTVVIAAFCAGTQLDRYLKDRADPRDIHIRAALDEKTELDFREQPLSDVIEYLKQRHEIEIQLDNKALTDAGIGTDAPITRSVKGIPLRSALNLILSDLDLTYVVQNGVLTITTNARAGSTYFSLKTLLWIMVAVAVLLGAIQCDRVWRRQAAA
ncbi:MAG TPA: DUF4974 domain-containing protein [Pirellulales bacterium]|nr:DUF4974 domain-containing protein [Pirellulales bacterium]